MDAIAVVFGAGIVVAASMLTKREEDAVPALIANSYVRLDDARIVADRWFMGAIMSAAAKASALLDRLVGRRLWSVRGVNLILAAGVAGFGLPVFCSMLVMSNVAGSRWFHAILPCGLVLALTGYLSWRDWGRSRLVIVQTVGVGAVMAFVSSPSVALVTVPAWFLSSGLSFVVSRALLRRTAAAAGTTTLLCMLLADVAVTDLLLHVPIVVGEGYVGEMRATSNAGTLAVVLNLSALALTLVCTLAAMSGLLHGLLWLVVLRPLHSLQRHWPIVSRKSLLMTGTALFLAGCTGWYVLLLALLPPALKAFVAGGPK